MFYMIQIFHPNLTATFFKLEPMGVGSGGRGSVAPTDFSYMVQI